MAVKSRPSLLSNSELRCESVLDDLDAFLEEEEEEGDSDTMSTNPLSLVALGEACAKCQAAPSPAMTALSNGHTACLKEILTAQSELGDLKRVMTVENQATLAHVAARKGDQDSLRVILEVDRSLCEVGDGKGATPLHVCAYHGHVECLRCLLMDGRSALLRDQDGATALHFAAASGHTECLRVLIKEGGADPNEQTESGETPGT